MKPLNANTLFLRRKKFLESIHYETEWCIIYKLEHQFKEYFRPSHKNREVIFYIKIKCKICGQIKSLPFHTITNRSKARKSCGCLENENRKKIGLRKQLNYKKIDGYIYLNIYNKKYYFRFLHMNQRCYLESDDHYNHYGKRGIYVCEEWRYYFSAPEKNQESIEHYFNFENWYDNELKKLNMTFEESKKLNYTIDRIDNDGPYAPWNCRLATMSQQMKNQRNQEKYKKRIEFLKKIGKTLLDLIITKNKIYIKQNKISQFNSNIKIISDPFSKRKYIQLNNK